MRNDLDHDLRETFRRHEQDLLGHGPTPSPSMFRRVRRRQTGTVLIAAVATAAIAIVGISGLGAIRASDQSPAVPGGAGTGPTATGPTVAPDPPGPGSEFVALLGATPSAPERGELVLGFGGEVDDGDMQFPGVTPIAREITEEAISAVSAAYLRVWVYADGRLIWNRPRSAGYAEGLWTGLFEQRLTPEGVELLRSELRSIPEKGCDRPPLMASFNIPDRGVCRPLDRLDALLTGEDPWLPASAWDDQVVRVFVPSRYSVCYDEAAVNLLPAPAQELVGKHTTCSDVTNEEARVLAEAFEDSGLLEQGPAPRVGAPPWGGYTAPELAEPGPPFFGAPPIVVSFEPILPHGEAVCAYCGVG